MSVIIKKQEPICLLKSAPATQKVHHILSTICPLKVQKSTEKNTKVQNFCPSKMALLCGFSDFIESCRNPNSIFDSRRGCQKHKSHLIQGGFFLYRKFNFNACSYIFIAFKRNSCMMIQNPMLYYRKTKTCTTNGF